MASFFQGRSSSSSASAPQRPLQHHENVNSSHAIHPGTGRVVGLGATSNMNGSPQNFANRALTEEEVAQLCDAMLYDEMMPLNTFNNQSYSAPNVHEGVIPVADNGISSGDWNLPYNSTTLRPTRIMTFAPDGQQRYEFICVQCGTKYDRMGRASDCRNQDLGLSPYQCEGRCGDSECPAAYGSEESWRRHLSPTVQCPYCHKSISKQNAARHKLLHRPNHQSP